jgi:hypothetical protein
VGLSVLATATPAAAYCRSTTCADGCARDASDCKTDGYPLYWASHCVGFSLQRNGSVNIAYPTIEQVVSASFVAWSDLACGNGNATLAFSRLADVTCNVAEYNEDGANANVIIFQDNRWDYEGTANSLGKTTVTYDSETGEILDADIELNHANNEFTTGDDYVVYDLQSVLTHEIGHLAGLDHTIDLWATMNPFYQSGTTDLRTLEPDDTSGICAVYPPGREGVCAVTPRGGLGDVCGGIAAGEEEDDGCRVAPLGRAGSRPRWAWLGAAGALAVAWRLRRSCRRTPWRGRPAA